MSARAKQFILRAARAIIKSNSASTVRKRLKGNLHERGQATKRLTDLIFQLRVTGDGRSWSGRGSADSAVHEMRQQASDSRLPAAIRCRAVINLAVYEGFLPVTELDDSAVSTWIRSVVEPKQEVKQPQPSRMSDVEAALARYEQARRGDAQGQVLTV